MTEPREQYRKLPGHRRGFIRGSSVWAGADHLLLVRSMRFREEYKRFHLRDIQAIVVANAPRFGFSTRAAVIAVVWVVVYFAVRNRAAWTAPAMWAVAIALTGTWLYISAVCSCVCRIYTAVSRDDLPSVYRTWIARRFLDEVQPLIWKAQGVVEGDWAEAIEQRRLGPPATVEPIRAHGAAETPRPTARSRTTASTVFAASLFADALLNLATLHSLTRAMQWVWYGLSVVEIAAAVAMFAEYHRGVLRSGMQRVAVAALVVMGIAYYARAAMSGMLSTANQLFPDPTAISSTPGYILARQADAAVNIVLVVVALAMMAKDESG